MADAFKFELVSPESLVLSEEVSAVVVPGSQGDLTVLKGHAPFMTTIRPGVIAVTSANGKSRQFFVRGGFADVSPAGLTILAEKATAVEELKGDAAANEIKLAEADLAAAKSDEGKAAAALKLNDVRAALSAPASVAGAH
jgi:F-type H+-transporting ATPase subunit epsilon